MTKQERIQYTFTLDDSLTDNISILFSTLYLSFKMENILILPKQKKYRA